MGDISEFLRNLLQIVPQEQPLQVRKNSLAAVFLEPDNDTVLPPLSPFMLHLWRLYGTQKNTGSPSRRTRETILHWFFDTVHRTRAPYSWPVPPETIAWANAPSVTLRFPAPPLSKSPCYLTRLMVHVWKHHRRQFDVHEPEGFLHFLSWFAIEWLPAQNLPRALLPEDLLEILNQPGHDESAPLTLAMLTRLPDWRRLLRELDRIDRATAVALSFQALPQVLRAGDPRLLPSYVTSFWLRPPAPGLEMTSYEYLSARIGSSDPAAPPQSSLGAAALTTTHLFAQRDLEVLFGAPSPAAPPKAGPVKSRPRAVFIYRDHNTPCGLTRSGQYAFDALTASGIIVIDIDFNFRRDRMHEEFSANECSLNQIDSAVHFLNLNPELVPECLATHLTRLNDKDYVIGQFYWELSDIGSAHRCGLSLVDEIWVASEYLRSIYTRVVEVPVIVMGQAVEVHPAAPVSRSFFSLPEESYLFLFSFDAHSGLLRKNPLDLALAFRHAFPSGSEKAGLVIKTMNTAGLQRAEERRTWGKVLDLAARDPRIVVIDRPFSTEQLAGLFECCDCYVSLHRSEGFGYGPAEALARGKPVIVTAYSGVTDFCGPETALLVDYKLCEVKKGTYLYMDPHRRYEWAAPNIDTAGEHMRRLYQDPGFGMQLGRNGKRLMAERYTVAALGRRYRARLRELGFWEGSEP